MHPALALEEPGARKAELCAEAGNLRREFCEQATELKPIAQAAQFAFDAVQAFQKTDASVPAPFDAALGNAIADAASKNSLCWRLLRANRIAAKGWTIIRAFEGIALRSERSAHGSAACLD